MSRPQRKWKIRVSIIGHRLPSVGELVVLERRLCGSAAAGAGRARRGEGASAGGESPGESRGRGLGNSTVSQPELLFGFRF